MEKDIVRFLKKFNCCVEQLLVKGRKLHNGSIDLSCFHGKFILDPANYYSNPLGVLLEGTPFLRNPNIDIVWGFRKNEITSAFLKGFNSPGQDPYWDTYSCLLDENNSNKIAYGRYSIMYNIGVFCNRRFIHRSNTVPYSFSLVKHIGFPDGINGICSKLNWPRISYE